MKTKREGGAWFSRGLRASSVREAHGCRAMTLQVAFKIFLRFGVLFARHARAARKPCAVRASHARATCVWVEVIARMILQISLYFHGARNKLT